MFLERVVIWVPEKDGHMTVLYCQLWMCINNYVFSSPRNWVLLNHVMILQVKLRMLYCVLCKCCECWIIIVLNYFWNCLILKCNTSLSMVRSYGVLRQSCSFKMFLGAEMRTPNTLSMVIIIIDNFSIALFSGVPKLTVLYNILQHFLSFTFSTFSMV